jgi:hypothetical protein
MVVNIDENITVTRMYVDFDSLLIFAYKSSVFCDAIIDGTCYVRPPLNLVVSAKEFGTGNVVRVNLSMPHFKKSTSVTTDPLALCTALTKHGRLPTVAFCVKNVLNSFPTNLTGIRREPKSEPFYVDVAINSIFKYPTNQEKHFTKRVMLCFLLIVALTTYYIGAFLF